MNWHVKLLKEDDDSLLIAYSYERNDTCDGLLRYDKKNGAISIEKMSDGADEFGTRWLFGPLRQVLNNIVNRLENGRETMFVGAATCRPLCAIYRLGRPILK